MTGEAEACINKDTELVAVQPLNDCVYTETTAPLNAGAETKAGMRRKKPWVSELIFYLALLLGVLAVFLFCRGNANQTSLFGYNVFTILTDSMTPDYPVNTLIITRVTDPGLIKAGDDITYVRSDNNIITHRVVEVHENYSNSGMMAFTTKGITNQFTDKQEVYADNVLGLVVWYNYTLGVLIAYIKTRYILVIILTLLIIGFGVAIRAVFSGGEKLKADKT